MLWKGFQKPKRLEVDRETLTERYGRFYAQPYERGFGTTVGNALRRVLLSSIEGAAITAVKIEGVQHEFTAIPHVKEDVIEFLLNVKELRLKAFSERSGRLFLDVKGEGTVCAGDIKPSADFEVVNPELHLATLDSPEAALEVVLYVEKGTGYVPAGSVPRARVTGKVAPGARAGTSCVVGARPATSSLSVEAGAPAFPSFRTTAVRVTGSSVVGLVGWASGSATTRSGNRGSLTFTSTRTRLMANGNPSASTMRLAKSWPSPRSSAFTVTLTVWG